jgi:hypothetical protein
MSLLIAATITSLVSISSASTQNPPPTCVMPSNVEANRCVEPSKIKDYGIAISRTICPKGLIYQCDYPPLPQGTLECVNLPHEPTYCQAAPLDVHQPLSYTLTSSNANVTAVQGMENEGYFELICESEQWTTLTVYISNSQGSSTVASAYVKCNPIPEVRL